MAGEKKRSLRPAAGALAVLLCAALAGQTLEYTQTPLLVAATLAVLWLYRRAEQNPLPRRTGLLYGAYSLLFSLAAVAGHEVMYTGGMRGKPTENYLAVTPADVAGALALAVLVWPVLAALHRLAAAHPIDRRAARPASKKLFLAAWAAIWLCWVPYLLSYYPAGIVGDADHALHEAMRPGAPATSHWVVLHILALRLFLWLGGLVKSDPNFGVFLYAVTQSILFSGVCAAVVHKLYRLGTPRWAVAGGVVLYAASGYFASYGMVIWKDTLFSAAVVLLVLFLWQMPADGKLTPPQCLAFAALIFFMASWRNNGLYVLIGCLAAAVLFLRRNCGRVLACGLAVVAAVLVIQGPVYRALGIQPVAFGESLSVPIQQIAATVNEGADLTPEQEEVLYAILPEEQWAKYCPTLSDDLKGNPELDQNYLKSHFGSFLKVWAQLLVPHFGTYVEAYLMQTLGFWQPDCWQGNYYDYYTGIDDIYGVGWRQSDWIDVFTGHSLLQPLSARCRFISSGTMVWLMLLCLALILGQGKETRGRRLLVLSPLLICWLVVMLAVPIAYSYRYVLMLPLALPLFLVLPLCRADAPPAP